jgi:hypothetical protein
MNLSFEQLIFAVIAFLVVAALHGFALAAAAGTMGDNSPRYEGRMTLNPFPQLDLLGLAAAVLTGAAGFGLFLFCRNICDWACSAWLCVSSPAYW